MSDRPACCGRPMYIYDKAQSGRQRYRCGQCGRSTTGTNNEDGGCGYPPQAAAENHARIRDKIRRGHTTFVVTGAQNNTRINRRFFEALKTFCEHRDAELVVFPVNYKNVSAYTANEEYAKSWPKDLWPYIVDMRLPLRGNVVLRPDVMVAATAANPLEGKQAIEGSRWTFFGHPQHAMEPVASPGRKLPKRMYTTGVLTEPNYSNTNAGAKAAFHHVTGAMVIEVCGGHAFVRQLNASPDGSFYDLDELFEPDGTVTHGHRALALTPGDEHVKHNCPRVRRATYDDDESIVNVLRPGMIFRHDVLDGYAGSHHHERDDVTKFRKYHRRDHDYRAELDATIAFIDETTPPWATSYIVDSNHHSHLYQWLSRVDPKDDPQNALLIHELKLAQYENSLRGETTDPFRIYAEPRLTCHCEWLDPSVPFLVEGVDYSQHGHCGPNGARGSAKSFAKTTYKMVVGHAHGARIVKGVYQAGTSTVLNLEYNSGLSDWTNTHVAQYPSGARTMLDVFKGRWHNRKFSAQGVKLRATA